MNRRLQLIIIFQLIIIAAFTLDLLTTYRNLNLGMHELHPKALAAPYIELAIMTFGNMVFGVLTPLSFWGKIPQISLFIFTYYPVVINEFNFYTL